MDNKKLRIGWFTLTCCEDSTIIFIEMFNKYYQDWLKQLEFIHAKVLQSKNRWEEMDVAFVEGAVASVSQEEKLVKIRSLSKKLIAIGACACTGMPSGQRNNLEPTVKEEIQGLMTRFDYSQTVKKLDEIVTVDDKVQGCPMTEQQFLLVLNKYLNEFGII